ncbi:hypothetical protein [Massilia sp. TN1-12]|uniref:hypothetical protein n=1 Tax=Massilia paldalensis TaxID=3377675 RepID=UPI00384DCCD5
MKTRLTVLATLMLAAAHGAQAATPAGTQISNTATATYSDGTGTKTATSNTVITTVQQVASLTMTAGTTKTAAAGTQVVFAHSITNTGNGADTFALSSTQSGAFTIANVQFFADADGNGVADNATPLTAVPSLAAGATFQFVAVATLPANAANGSSNSLVVTATSNFTATVKTSSTDTTNVGAGSTMDITANGSGLGAGAGAEASPVVTNTTAPGTTTRFTLNLNNGGGIADTFNLAASTDGTFGSTTLPSGWTVVFRDSTGAVITSATVNPNSTTVVYADVTPPAGATAGTTDLYFRALSPTTNVKDILHDAVIVNPAATQLSLVKTQALDANCDGTADTAYSAAPITTGALPGACIRYKITATNTGTTNVTAVTINDDIPANTTYYAGNNPVSASLGSIVTVLTGQVSTMTTAIPTLTPNQSGTMEFGVRINQ